VTRHQCKHNLLEEPCGVWLGSCGGRHRGFLLILSTSAIPILCVYRNWTRVARVQCVFSLLQITLAKKTHRSTNRTWQDSNTKLLKRYLQVGHEVSCSSHDLKQGEWNKCPHGSFLALSISSQQIAHWSSTKKKVTNSPGSHLKLKMILRRISFFYWSQSHRKTHEIFVENKGDVRV